MVSVVLDQLGSWALFRYRDLLLEGGILRRAIEDGVYIQRARYPFGATITAAGHASLHTGVLPSTHGVVANERYDPKRGGKRALVDDGEHRVLGAGGFASPQILRSPTVADVLKAVSAGRARVVSISLKDRGAILPAGQNPDFVAFYSAEIPGFTTSAFYTETMPRWFRDWTGAHPVDAYLSTWSLLDVTRAWAGTPDDRPVEADVEGFGRTFPHDPRRAKNPAGAFRLTPNSTRYQLELAERAVRAFGLGEDKEADLLLLSVSATDYVGHAFGAESLEYVDMLLRTDRMLGDFIRTLEERTSTAVIITSDHGHAPCEAQPPSPRLVPSELVAALEQTLRRRFGEGQYVTGYHLPYLYFSERVMEHKKREAILDAALDLLNARDEVAWAARTLEAAQWQNDPDPLRRLVAAGIEVGRGGPIYLVPEEGVIVDPGLGGGGTTHGTPHLYDREVPVLAVGAGVGVATSTVPQDILRYAATLSALLGVPPPRGAPIEPLPGFERGGPSTAFH